MSAPIAVFRADASAALGGGHVMRCLTLADALVAAGWRTAFAVSAETVAVVPGLAGGPHDVHGLEGGEGRELREMAEAVPRGCDLLVVDHYGRDGAWERQARPWARAILAMEDLPGRTHACDFLLDPAPRESGAQSDRKVTEGCRALLGPEYALLRPEFARWRSRALAERAGRSGPGRILVGLGATDADNVTATVLEGLQDSVPGWAVDVVLGAGAPHLEAVRARLAAWPGPARLHVATAEMARLMAEADFAVGAAGGTSWERCCLGLPTLAIMTAENQRRNHDALAAAGAITPLGRHGDLAPETLAAAAAGMARDAAMRAGQGAAAAALCDGQGVGRILAALAPPRARTGDPVSLRPVTAADAELLLAWQRHPCTRRHARNPKPPERAEHMAWLDRRLSVKDGLFDLILLGDRPAGMVRLDPLDADHRFEVSILVAPDRHRLGLASAALGLARLRLPTAELVATVLPGNAASAALFHASGYVPDGDVFIHRGAAAP